MGFLMRQIKLILGLAALLLLVGCRSVNIGAAPVLKAGIASASGFAAYSLAPDKWSQSEKTALGFGTAAAAWILGEIVEGKINKDKLEAYDTGFATGRAYGARRQYEIIQQMQKSVGSRGRTRTYALPAPAIPGIKQVEHEVYLELQE